MPSISQANSVRSTSSVDPLGKSAKWINNAEEIRRHWMELMGMSQEDIKYHLINDPPTDPDEELAQYNAMFRIQDSCSN